MITQGSSAIVAVAEQRPERTVCVGGEERMETKDDGVVRIGFNNINGFGSSTNDNKNHELYGFIKEGDFDVFGMAETNVHWSNSKTQPKDLMYGWFKRSHIAYKYYKEYPGTANYQVGGVLQLGIGDITCRIKEHGGDESGQGRWTWQRFSGKEQRTLRIVTAYRPVKNTVNAGSVWHQQQYYADCYDLHGSPHDRWIQDLKTAVQGWLEQGDTMILMGDFNKEVRTGPTVQALKQLGLVDHLVSQHTTEVLTFARGTTTIDTILTLQEIIVTKCGYSRSPSDHLCVWLDIRAQQLFEQIQQPVPSHVRRLQCGDPRTVNRYIQSLWKEIQKHNIHEEYAQILEDSQLRPIKQQRKWEQLDKKLLKLRLKAEKKCRRLKMGKVSWSPELAQNKITLKYWCLAKRTMMGKSIDRKFFRRIANAANLPERVQEDSEQIQAFINIYTNIIKQYKKSHVKKRETWLEGLASALAAEEASNSTDMELKRLKHIKQLHQREQQRQSARTIRHAVASDNNHQQLNHIVFDDEEGNKITMHDKLLMERQLILENKKRFNQATGSPFLVEPLASWVGRFGELCGADKILSNVLGNVGDSIESNSLLLLHEMKRPDTYAPSEVDLTYESFA
jgi:exonuclease III/sulfur relay (sulfurtransferase) DsrC/TusE family protein